MEWKKELLKLIENGCSDSDIEDFVDEHYNVNGKEIWDFIYDHDAPEQCKGCTYIQHKGFMPCLRCCRIIKLKDYYEPRT